MGGLRVHGLARVRLDRTRLEDLAAGYTVERIPVPDGAGGALALACDPADGSVWVGFAWGGFGRWKDGWRTVPAQQDVPEFARGPVRSIQVDAGSAPRTVWMAHLASRLGPAGLTAYDGP